MTPDPGLFAGTAHFYARHRPQYAPELIDHLRQRFGLDGTGRLLDLGCGTGQLAIPLASFFAETIAMDPDAAMLTEGRQLEAARGFRGIRWLVGSSENLGDFAETLRPLRLVTMGASFHWMNRDRTLQTLAELLEPGGGLAIVADSAARQSATGLNAWWDLCLEVVRHWLGPERRAGSGTFVALPESHDQVLARSAFQRIETWSLPVERQRDVDSILGLLYSTSYASPAVLADRREDFEADLRRRLSELNPSGLFAEHGWIEATLAWLR